MGSYSAYLVETLLTLVLVCALAYAVLYGARRLGVGRPEGPVRLVGALPLPRAVGRVVYLVQVGAHVYVVAAGEGGFTKLGEIPASELPPDDLPLSVRKGPSFDQVLARLTGRTRGAGNGGGGA